MKKSMEKMKAPLWYNPIGRAVRDPGLEEGVVHMTAEREGCALWDAYGRLLRRK